MLLDQIMLNLLISLMSDSFEKVQQMAKGEWRRELAKIIIELEQVRGSTRHACRPALPGPTAHFARPVLTSSIHPRPSQVLAVISPPEQLQAWEPRWLHVLREVGRDGRPDE